MISGNKQRKRRGSRLLLDGRIVSLDEATFIDVKIREISATGAILRIPRNVNVPENFHLDGKRYPAEKRWRKGERLEVKFVGERRIASSHKGNKAI